MRYTSLTLPSDATDGRANLGVALLDPAGEREIDPSAAAAAGECRCTRQH